MKQYLDLCHRIVNEGKWVANERTGKSCLTVINADLIYDVEKGEFPLVTTRRSYWKAAIAELLGYIRGYDNAADFRNLGTKSWDANANENAAWLANPYRKGEDDMGLVYGAVGRNFPKPDGGSVDLLRQIVDDLKKVLIIGAKFILSIIQVHFIWGVCVLVCIATIFHCWMVHFILTALSVQQTYLLA